MAGQMKKTIRFILFASLITLLATQTYAASVGYLVIESGIIKHRRNHTDRIYQKPDKKISLNNKDEIQTGKNTRVRIFLRSKNEIIQLYSNSFFRINAISKKQSFLSMPIGKIRCLVKKTINRATKRRRRFQVKTATAVIGVKGTDFIVQSDGVSTNVLTLDGIVSMSSQ